MLKPPQLAFVAAAGIWLVCVVGFGLLGLAALGAVYDGFLNCDYDGVVDAGVTTFVWAIVLFVSLMPMGIGLAVVAITARKLMAILAVTTAGLELWVWWWLLDPICRSGSEAEVGQKLFDLVLL